ncbi:MAG: LysR family transcriptional regulator [Sporomusaceae bacterium]|nr:LysR family transcriptional regulator [Sporomusaceae bacterium]
MAELPSIQQLENFIIYGKVRNFTAAAKQANITQSAFSSQIKKLEELVGIQLIARSNKGSDLTEAGELFLVQVQKIMGELFDCMYDMKKLSGTKVTLAIGALIALGDVLMNQHLAYFQQHNLNITLNVYNLEAHELFRYLAEGKLDIVSTFLLPENNMGKFEKVFFCNDKMVFYAPNIKTAHQNISVESMASYPLVQYSPHYLMNSFVENFFQMHHFSPMVRAWLSTPYAIMNYCEQNEMGALLSERLLNAMGIFNGYYELAEPFNLQCYLLYKKNNPKHKAIKVFIDYILDFYKVK